METVIPAELVKRTRVYVMRPAEYEISGCPCGNNDPEWSEYVGHLWCEKCQKDFKPEFNGVFDGPICIQACELMGISLSMFDLETQKIVTNAEYMAEAAAERESRKPTQPTQPAEPRNP
jgi:hypothetical protein